MRADNTFNFKGLRCEAPRHLPDRVIQVRFERKRAVGPAARIIVYYKRERMGPARPLDLLVNDRKPTGGQKVSTASLRQAPAPAAPAAKPVAPEPAPSAPASATEAAPVTSAADIVGGQGGAA